MKNLTSLENAQLVKSIIEKKSGLQYNINLIYIEDLKTLSLDQTTIFYYGILTIGRYTNSMNIVLKPQDLETGLNFTDQILFNSITDDMNTFPLPFSIQGNFYGYVLTPTNKASKSINLDI